jgi:hypothetical protein
MLPFILGAVALGTVGYGVKKHIESDIDRSIEFDNATIKIAENLCTKIDDFTFNHLLSDIENTNTNEIDTKYSLEDFYTLRNSVYETTYNQYINIISSIDNLSLKHKNINIKNVLPKDNSHFIQNKVIDNMYIILDNLNHNLDYQLSILNNILKVSNHFNTFSKDVKFLISDIVVNANIINKVLNIKIVNKNDNLSRKTIKFAKEYGKFVINNTLLYK